MCVWRVARRRPVRRSVGSEREERPADAAASAPISHTRSTAAAPPVAPVAAPRPWRAAPAPQAPAARSPRSRPCCVARPTRSTRQRVRGRMVGVELESHARRLPTRGAPLFLFRPTRQRCVHPFRPAPRRRGLRRRRGRRAGTCRSSRRGVCRCSGDADPQPALFPDRCPRARRRRRARGVARLCARIPRRVRGRADAGRDRGCRARRGVVSVDARVHVCARAGQPHVYPGRAGSRGSGGRGRGAGRADGWRRARARGARVAADAASADR